MVHMEKLVMHNAAIFSSKESHIHVLYIVYSSLWWCTEKAVGYFLLALCTFVNKWGYIFACMIACGQYLISSNQVTGQAYRTFFFKQHCFYDKYRIFQQQHLSSP